jgi:hypothetical protein
MTFLPPQIADNSRESINRALQQFHEGIVNYYDNNFIYCRK